MPKWIHGRAEHLMEKNPEMSKSQAFAIATQQSYASGKAPKGYGTTEGRREALQKYDDPKSSYERTADPGQKTKTSSPDSSFWAGFADEFEKIAFGAVTVSDVRKASKNPTLAGKPYPVSRPAPVGNPAPAGDPAGAAKMVQPPPVTVGG